MNSLRFIDSDYRRQFAAVPRNRAADSAAGEEACTRRIPDSNRAAGKARDQLGADKDEQISLPRGPVSGFFAVFG